MEKTRDLLMSDYNNVNDLLKVVEPNDEKHGKLMKERDDIRNELIKLDEVEMKREEIEAENKREKIRNGITIGTFVVSSAIGIWAVVKTFRFDQDGTVTSTLGRGILSGIIPKFNKK